MSRYDASPIVSRETDAVGLSHHTWVDTLAVESARGYRFIDLFSGCGGLFTGCIAAGLRPVLAVENWGPAAATHRLNHPGVWLYDRDIVTLSERMLRSSLGDEWPDVLVGGPPCTKYSTMGSQDTNHPIALLYLQYLRVVATLRPHICVIESVPGLLRPRCRHLLNDMLRRLDGLGYTASVQVLNAAWYGVPQIRTRVIIVGNRHGLPNPYPQPLLERECEFVATRQVLLDLAGLPRDLSWSHDWPASGEELRSAMTLIRPGQRVRPHPRACRRLDSERPAWTVMHHNGASFVHPWLPRKISAREMARLQGFPDEFGFRGSSVDQMHQIGNAVPPPLARHIALAVRTLLDEVADGDCPDAARRDAQGESAVSGDAETASNQRRGRQQQKRPLPPFE